jgi:hypothetical protein
MKSKMATKQNKKRPRIKTISDSVPHDPAPDRAVYVIAAAVPFVT